MTPADVLPYPRTSPESVQSAARQLRLLAERSVDATRVLQSEADALTHAWQGPASVACRQELAAASSLVRRVGLPLRDASAVLLRFAEDVVVARQAVDRLRFEYAENLAQHRAETSRVLARAAATPTMQHLLLEALEDEQRRRQAAFRRRHQDVLDALRVSARATGGVLQTLAADLVPQGLRPGAQPADAEAALAEFLPMLFAHRSLRSQATGVPLPRGTAPRTVQAWWALLTPDERDRLIARHARALGRLDGLPAVARTRANELVLNHTVGRLQNLTRPTPLEARQLANAVLVQRRLAQLRRRVDPVTNQPLVAQLVVFEPSAFAGEGRAALSIGNLDTAEHVAYLVPGRGSNLDKTWQGLTGDAHRVSSLARERAPSQATAVVAWMGYDAPEIINAPLDNAAEAGAKRLVRDIGAMHASREVAPHVTIVGHSYGSTTAGEALQQPVEGVGDVVMIGSPGASVEHARDLHVPPGHVYVGASSRDLVSYADWFGEDPAQGSFGGTRFEAEDPTRDPYAPNFDDHSKYFRSGSASVDNIVSVVVGDYEEVSEAPARFEVWIPRVGNVPVDPEFFREATVTADAQPPSKSPACVS